MASSNAGGIRLVRCPKCLNVLTEVPTIPVYKCGGCGTTLRAKIRSSNRQNDATKSVCQDSDDCSVGTSLSNELPLRNKHIDFSDIVTGSCSTPPDVPTTQQQGIVMRNHEDGDVMPAEKHAFEVRDAENKVDDSLDGQRMDARMEDSDKAENGTVEGTMENSEVCREREVVDAECSLNVPECNLRVPKGSKDDMCLPDSEERGTCETESASDKKNSVRRAEPRFCDLQEGLGTSAHSADYHSARTSLGTKNDAPAAAEGKEPSPRRDLRSKSFRASEPLQRKILKAVDELRGDLSELFSESTEGKPRTTRPPRLPKEEGYTARACVSLPPRAYHRTVHHSGNTARLSSSGQVAPRGLPSRRYRRNRAASCCHHEHTRPFPRDHYHNSRTNYSCQPPCCRSRAQEPALQKPPPALAKETKRRPLPRHHCRPVLRGAPFVICSNCFKLVQLPANFVVPSRGVRTLQCGSCSHVLTYSYRDPSSKKPQPLVAADHSSKDGSDIHETGPDHYTGFPQAHPISYSEDYGLSFGVSYSTEDEHEDPLYVSRNSSFNTVDDRNGKGPRLHRLMGYSSASELLRQSPDLYESFDRRTPNANARAYDRKGKGICLGDDSDEEEGIDKLKRSKGRSVGLPLKGILKKGMHGLEAMKLKS